jgi:hypothetical protein
MGNNPLNDYEEVYVHAKIVRMSDRAVLIWLVVVSALFGTMSPLNPFITILINLFGVFLLYNFYLKLHPLRVRRFAEFSDVLSKFDAVYLYESLGRPSNIIYSPMNSDVSYEYDNGTLKFRYSLVNPGSSPLVSMKYQETGEVHQIVTLFDFINWSKKAAICSNAEQVWPPPTH